MTNYSLLSIVQIVGLSIVKIYKNFEVFDSNVCEEQFWDVTPRILGNICQSFGGIC
jgi:hypothetical protein